MQRIDSEDVSASLPAPQPLGATPGYFKDPDAILGTLGTKITADWLNAIQEEIAGVILEAGLTLDKTATDQLKTAVLQLISTNATSEAEVLDLISDNTLSEADVINLINSNAVDSYSADQTLTTANSIVLVNASVAPVTITLPSPTNGKVLNIKKTDSSANLVTILPPSGTIDGAASKALEAQYDGLTVTSDGSNFYII